MPMAWTAFLITLTGMVVLVVADVTVGVSQGKLASMVALLALSAMMGGRLFAEHKKHKKSFIHYFLIWMAVVCVISLVIILFPNLVP